ncbi:MAG: DUF4080 domain-containing protein [Phascolarctobacterium sp.]|nr:DUF4080 domain-containing protein [Phascolarctobacterium sp.]
MKAVLVGINSKYIHTALGLRYVGEYAKSVGHEITLIEETINSQSLAVLEKIMEHKAKVYAFSVHIWNKPFVFKIVRMLKKLRPESIIVLGGPEVAFDVERIFSELPVCDYIIEGEGELVFAELLTALENRGNVPRHIAYIKDGDVQINGGTTVIEDMSILPFPYPDLDKVLAEHRIVYYEATRGCPFNCSYCLSGITKSVRKRPLDLVLADLDRFIAAGAKLVKFVDRTYNLDERYFLPMLEHLAVQKTDATFHLEIKADALSEKVMQFLANVPKHRFQMEIGIQSTNPPTLKAINRVDNWQKLSSNVKRLLSYKNMHIHVDLIAGLPYETLKEFAKSFDDVYALGADMLQLGFLKVLPGTQMRSEEEQHGLKYMDEPPYEILATNCVPYEDMQFLKRLENVFDQTANAGCFKHILQSLIKHSNLQPFEFYTALVNWWVKKGHYPQNHNAKGTAEILAQYIKEMYSGKEAELLLEVLRYDVFINIPGWEPSWLTWQAQAIFDKTSEFWRAEELAKKYVPNYKFSSWRAIHKNYPIERFNFHPDSELSGEYYVLVDNTSAGKIIFLNL